MFRPCPVCGNLECSVIEQIHMAMPEKWSLPEKYNIVACSRCGCCYADTPATQSDYDDYYTTNNNYSETESSKLFDKTFAPIREFVSKNVPFSGKILDIGFGKGELLLQLRELGYMNLTGLDPSQHSVDRLREHGIRAYRKSVYDAPDELADSFDLVFLTSVVEHLLEPKAAINQACMYVRTGGYLIIDIPDYSMADKVDLPIPNQFNQEHINYFSVDSFAAMLYGTQCRLVYSKPIELKDDATQISEYTQMFMIRKCGDTAIENTEERKRDDRTEAAIKRYLLQGAKKQEKIAAVIDKLCDDQTPLIVCGVLEP